MRTVLACFGLALASGLMPWVNAEFVLLVAAAPLTSFGDLLPIVLAMTVGQMIGKGVLYWIARRAPNPTEGRFGRAVERWRTTCEKHPTSAEAMMFVSAVFGLPPLYVTSVAAGALRINFVSFVSVATVGRLLHFGAIAMLPSALRGT